MFCSLMFLHYTKNNMALNGRGSRTWPLGGWVLGGGGQVGSERRRSGAGNRLVMRRATSIREK